jgi:dTDP-4-amino-4,6-dideoxygalactose transaminase
VDDACSESLHRSPNTGRIYLSPPHMSGLELDFVREAFESNWIAPVGPQVDAFEKEFAEHVGIGAAAALNSGTAAIHLALLLVGVKADDEVLVPTLTFCGSANPVAYVGARPTFIDSEAASWNLDPDLVEEVLVDRAKKGRLPGAVIAVHLYGQTANMGRLRELCQRFDVPLIEDAAEALGADYKGRAAGTMGRVGIFSFNGNKIMTTSGGGMLVSDDRGLIERARKLAQQAREPAPHYQHETIGYNYRLSNILAGIGRGQLKAVDARVRRKREINAEYRQMLEKVPGVQFMPEAPWGRPTHWLTCITVDPEEFGVDRERLRLALEAENIESRPLWKPMHLQPVFSRSEVVGGGVSEGLFENGLCLPSGPAMRSEDLERVVGVIRALAG